MFGKKKRVVWETTLVPSRPMLPTDVGMRFKDGYGDGWGNPRYGIAVAIEPRMTNHHIRDNWVEYLVVDETGHRTRLDNCWVSDDE